MPRWKSMPIPDTYIPPNPCSKCGTSLRYRKSWNCVECHKQRGRKVVKPEAIENRPAIG